MGSKSGEIHYYQYHESHDRGLSTQFTPMVKLEHELCYGKLHTRLISFDSMILLAYSLGNIFHMFVSPTEDSLGLLSTDGQFLRLNITAPANLSTDKLSYVMAPFHTPKSITGLDVCVRKPLFLTSCKDNFVKIWNFRSHELELQKSFGEEIFSVALHPNGLHCAIAFSDKLRLYHILVDDFRLCLEVSAMIHLSLSWSTHMISL